MIKKLATNSKRYPIVGTLKILRVKAYLCNDPRWILAELAQNVGKTVNRGDAKQRRDGRSRRTHDFSLITVSQNVYFLSAPVIPKQYLVTHGVKIFSIRARQ
jgi:hypothetical protein